ncbi:hypothetical protein JKP88DRAFT_297941 [Tribonema minus]|uniref:Uncharacterized protein n=1 Tax=Tribonema minus TaxID=303371 RepID=A0A835ZHN7_9STRA|nr:hypothetical protein JKP88DRAFT_297941 [Tribonema minus]
MVALAAATRIAGVGAYTCALGLAPRHKLTRLEYDQSSSADNGGGDFTFFSPAALLSSVMFVDDDGNTARLLEGLTEKIAIWWDSGWWVYPFSSSVGRVRDGSAADQRVMRVAQKLRLDKGDLDSYDIIVAVDGPTRKQALRLLKGSMTESEFAFYEGKIRVLSDFIDYPDAFDKLEPDLKAFAAAHKDALVGLSDIPHAYITRKEEYTQMVAALVLGAAGVVRFIVDMFEEYYKKRQPAPEDCT